jgi:hypothetical protein
LRELLTTFREAGTRALEDAVVGLTHLINTSEKVLLISAQMQDSDIHWATDMMTTETRGKQHVLLFDSGYVPRTTVTWKVKDGTHLRVLLKGFLDKKQRVACFCETVKMAQKIKAWFDSVYPWEVKQARCFTADVNAVLRKKGIMVGEYAQDCDLFLYTIGLGLGMNLLPVFDIRFMVADVGFISAKRLSQAAGRPRNCVLPDLYICIGNSGWQNSPGDGIEEMAKNKVMSEHQDSLISAVVDGRMERVLPENDPATTSRLELATAMIEESRPDKKMDMILHWSDKARCAGNAPGYHLVHPRDEHWDKLHVDVVDPLRQQWDQEAVFLTKQELITLMSGLTAGMVVSVGMAMTNLNFKICKSIMPYMVADVTSQHALPKELLYSLYKNNNHAKLQNFLQLVEGTAPAEHHKRHGRYYTAAEMMFPEWNDGNISQGFGSTRSQAAVALMVACGSTLEVDIGPYRRNARSMVHPGQDILALHTVSPQQQQEARDWINKHWEKRFALKRGTTAPVYGEERWWKYIRHFMRNTFGLGVQQKKKDSGDQDDYTYRLVTSTLWNKYNVDLLQVAMDHRTRDLESDDGGHVLHNNRPFGVIGPQMRKCDQCPSTRAESMCVRQHGNQWLCMHGDPNHGYAARSHRDYHTAIDVGYLDVEIPNSDRDDAIRIEEILPERLEYKGVDNGAPQTTTTVAQALSGLPEMYRHLLRDLGFGPGVLQVDGQQMQTAWESMTESDYLLTLDKECKCTLYHYANIGDDMKCIRKMAKQVLQTTPLGIQAHRSGTRAARSYIYTLSFM